MNRTAHTAAILTLLFGALACTTPSKIEITPKDVVLDKAGRTQLLSVKVLDQDGKEMSTRGIEINWYCEDTSVVKLTQDGVVTAVASGEAEVTAEVAETGVKETVTVEVKIPSAVQVSIDKLRLEAGESKDDVWASVRTERGAMIQDLKPSWSSENTSVVRVEPAGDTSRPQSFVKLTGVSSGVTRVTARYENFTQEIRVTVFGEGEEVEMVGNGISEKKTRDAKRGKTPKSSDARRVWLSMVAANVLFSLVSNSAIFLLSDDDDEKRKAIQDALLAPLNGLFMIPIVGGSLEAMTKSGLYGYQMKGSSIDVFERTYRDAKKGLSEGDVMRAIKPVTELVLGTNLDPFIGLYDLLRGEDVDEATYEALGIPSSQRPE